MSTILTDFFSDGTKNIGDVQSSRNLIKLVHIVVSQIVVRIVKNININLLLSGSSIAAI